MRKAHYSPGFYIATKMFIGLRKKYLLISNTDLIQTSLTKANHEIFLHLNFFPPLTLFYLHTLYYLENLGCVLEVSNTRIVVHEKRNESDHSLSMTGYKMLRYNCLLVFPNPHRNLPFFLCPDSQKSMV